MTIIFRTKSDYLLLGAIGHHPLFQSEFSHYSSVPVHLWKYFLVQYDIHFQKMPSIIWLHVIRYKTKLSKLFKHLCTQLTFHTEQGHDLQHLYLEFNSLYKWCNTCKMIYDLLKSMDARTVRDYWPLLTFLKLPFCLPHPVLQSNLFQYSVVTVLLWNAFSYSVWNSLSDNAIDHIIKGFTKYGAILTKDKIT